MRLMSMAFAPSVCGHIPTSLAFMGTSEGIPMPAVHRLVPTVLASVLAWLSPLTHAADATAKPKPTVTASSHQGGSEPDRALDGDRNSLWHSRWGEPKATLPQWIQIDQGVVDTVACLLYQPRPDGGNGTVTKYNVAISDDGTTFTTVVKDGTWAANNKRKVVSFTPVKTRYVRLEVLEGNGGFASAAEVVIAPTVLDPNITPGQVAVTSPAYGAEIQGDTPISITAPGFSSVMVSCWQAGPDAKSHGSEATIGAVTLDASGKGSVTFPADQFPHGPLCVRIAANTGTLRDTCWLQLYNRGGAPWKQGAPKETPPAAAGMTLLYVDDFEKMPTIADKDPTAAYFCHKPPDGVQDFSSLRFTNPDQPGNPFHQSGTWLRIRADEKKKTSGLITPMKRDGSGFTARIPCYFECRFIGPNATGAWPAFWLLTKQPAYPDHRGPCDELDIIEAYGGEGPGRPNAWDKYCVTPHRWNQGPQGKKEAEAEITKMGGIIVSMKEIGIPSTWFQTAHTYGCKITETDTIYYCDDIEIRRHATFPVSKQDPFYFLINLATGGGWPVDLSRYDGVADMYVDYVRVYGSNPGDVEKAEKGKSAK